MSADRVRRLGLASDLDSRPLICNLGNNPLADSPHCPISKVFKEQGWARGGFVRVSAAWATTLVNKK